LNPRHGRGLKSAAIARLGHGSSRRPLSGGGSLLFGLACIEVMKMANRKF